MGFFAILLLVLFAIVSGLLIFLVIIQDEDSESLGGIFAGGSGSVFGSRSSNVVVKITYVLGGLFFVLAFAMALVNKSSTGNVEALATQTTQSQTAGTEWWKGETGNQEQQAPAADGTETGTQGETTPTTQQ